MIRAHRALKQSDVFNHTCELVELNFVAEVDPLPEQHDQARREVIDHVLEAEADAHANRSKQHGEPVDVDTGGGKSDQDTDQNHGVARQLYDRGWKPATQVHERQEVRAENEADELGKLQ